MGESFELKFKLIGDRKWNSKIYPTYELLEKDIISFRDGCGKLDGLKISGFDSFLDYEIIKRNYDLYEDGKYYHEPEQGEIVDIDDLLREVDFDEYLKTGGFKNIEEDITYKLSKKLGFISNKIESFEFKNKGIYINGDYFHKYSKKFIGSISHDFLMLISSYFEEYDNENSVEVLDLIDFYDETPHYIYTQLTEKKITKDNIRKTYIPAIHNNVNKIYKKDKILEIKGSLITVLAV